MKQHLKHLFALLFALLAAQAVAQGNLEIKDRKSVV